MTQHQVAIPQSATRAVEATRTLASDFKAFLERGSLVDLAVGIIVGGAFNTIVQSFVTDLITPIIGLISQKNLENNFLVIKCSEKSTVCQTGSNNIYATIAEAAKDSAVTWNWGKFIQNVIYFLIVALVMFFVVKAYTNLVLKPKPAAPEETKKCESCLEEIHKDAKKCKFCASSQ
ncbi:large-conductance mechanosensitive channel [Obelidium mucronatum]|nr:large-conductance mechanosensitive channel [Obelidium mucronatum]